jgi:hypothetical protein
MYKHIMKAHLILKAKKTIHKAKPAEKYAYHKNSTDTGSLFCTNTREEGCVNGSQTL